MSIICKMFGHKPGRTPALATAAPILNDPNGLARVFVTCTRCRTPFAACVIERPNEWKPTPAPTTLKVNVPFTQGNRIRMAGELYEVINALVAEDFEHVSGGLRLHRDHKTFHLVGDLIFKATTTRQGIAQAIDRDLLKQVHAATTGHRNSFESQEQAARDYMMVRGVRGARVHDIVDDALRALDTPWYPDDSGQWVEVSESSMLCPLTGDSVIEVLTHRERETRRFFVDPMPARHAGWTHMPKTDLRIVAYKLLNSEVIFHPPARPTESPEVFKNAPRFQGGAYRLSPGETPVTIKRGYEVPVSVLNPINDTPTPPSFSSGEGGSYAGAGASASWSNDSSSCSSSDTSSSSSDCSSSSSSD